MLGIISNCNKSTNPWEKEVNNFCKSNQKSAKNDNKIKYTLEAAFLPSAQNAA